ncbi:UNVERIFIED_CONTAM: hypothetical protein FKN15_046038 [Acipenser sinensis]
MDTNGTDHQKTCRDNESRRARRGNSVHIISGVVLDELQKTSMMKRNEKYSSLPIGEKGVDIINIKAIEDIGYVQTDAMVGQLWDIKN